MKQCEADVVIAGGGLSGVTAALSAVRAGARVMIVEKAPRFGGMASGAMVHSMLTFHGRKGHRIVGGLAEEIICRLKRARGTPGHVLDTVGVAYSVTPTDPLLLSLVLQTMLDEAACACELETHVLDAQVHGGTVSHLRCYGPGGPLVLKAPFFVDATGEGALAASCGVPFESGRDGIPMPATLIFNVRNVNLPVIMDYVDANQQEFHHETLFGHVRKSPAPGISGFFSLWKEGGLSIPRDRLLFYKTLNDDEVAVNSTRITNFDPFDGKKLSHAHREALEQVFELYAFLRARIPGFEHSVISSIAPQLGIREGRRIKGSYALTGNDVASGRRFDDEIAFGGFPVDIHLPGSSGIETVNLGGEGFYGIPYRCLLPQGISNMLITGKCLSADFEAHASARVQATAMALGEAAGLAAALSRDRRTVPPCLSPGELRQALADRGAVMEPCRIEELP